MKRAMQLSVVLILAFCMTHASFASEPVILTFYARSDSTWHDQPVVDLFNATHTDVKVNLLPSKNGLTTYWEEITTQIVGGVAPDIIWTDWKARELGDQGLLMDLTAYAAKDAFFQKQQVIKPLLDSMSYGGKLYGIPNSSSAIFSFINHDVFNEVGLAIPVNGWSWDDFLKATHRITKRKDDGTVTRYGFNTLPSWEWWSPFVYSFGGQIMDETGTQLKLRDSAAMAGLRTFIEMARAGDQAPFGPAWKKGFGENRVGIHFNGDWSFASYSGIATLDWDIYPVPTGPAGSRSPALVFGYSGLASTKHPKEVWQFLSWCTSAEAQKTRYEVGMFTPSAMTVLREVVSVNRTERPLNQMVILNALGSGAPPTWGPKQSEIIGAVNTNVLAALNLQVSLEEALQKADDAVKNALNKK